jgi:hypothetical protein
MISGAETAALSLRPGMPLVDGRLPVVQASIASALGLSEGQVVKAAVDPQSGAIQLQLQQQGRLIELQRDAIQGLRLPSGDTALFRVQLLASGAIVLRPLATANSGAARSSAEPSRGGGLPSGTDANRVATLLGRPPATVALATLLQPQTLIDLARSLGNSDAQAALLDWMRARPSMSHLSGERLASFLARSGWMTEALLARGETPEGQDLKSAFRKLLEVDPTHPQASSISQALDEIECQQAHAAAQASGQEWSLSFMLPFADAQPVSVRISRDPDASREDVSSGPRALYVQMHTQSSHLGELWLLSVHRDQRIELTVWAAQEDTAQRARALAPRLSGELADAGLEVTALQVVHGARPQQRPRDMLAAQAAGRLLDIQT